MSPESLTAFGIDLGTTFSVIAQVNEAGIPVTLPNSEGAPTTPSVVLFDGDEVIVGAVAREAIAVDPEQVVQLAKRRIGSEWAFPYRGLEYRAEHVTALIAKKLVQDARRLVGSVLEAVVTVPAYFNDAIRDTTKQAAELADIRVLGLLSEPTAAAIAFGYDRRLLEAQGIVVDLGGGTFDVTVLEFERESLRVLATGGDAYLGGANFDKVIFDHFVRQFDQMHGLDVQDPDALSIEDFTQVSQEWLLRADRVKHDLSARERTAVQLQAAGLSLRLEVTRRTFEELSRVLLDEMSEKLLDVLHNAGLKPADIDVALAVGGATRIPMVQDRIRSVLGRSLDTSVRPDEAVALGAAIEAARLQLESGSGLVLDPVARKHLEAMSVTDVSSHSMGISVFAGPDAGDAKLMDVLLPRNTPLPNEGVKVFYTRHPNETRIVIPILEGDGPDPEQCTRIGQVVIDGLPSGRPAFQPVKITMTYNRDGILEVTASDEATKASVSTKIERVGGGGGGGAQRTADAVRHAVIR